MLVRDVVYQLRLILPEYTDLFSDMMQITSIVANSGVVTVTTQTPHNLNSGDKIPFIKVKARTPILSLVSQDWHNFTFESQEHDLTLHIDGQQVEFAGFSDPSWNDSFDLVDVINRKRFTIQSLNSAPILTGSEVLLEENRLDRIRGIYEITVVDPLTFTASGSFPDGIYTVSRLPSFTRITGVRSLDRFISQLYTKQTEDTRLWGVVEPHMATISKDRSTFSDATATFPSGTDMRLRIIDGFTFSVIKRVVNEIAAAETIDLCRELRYPIYKSLFGAKFDTGFQSGSDFMTIPIGDREAPLTTGNNAYYAHSFDFEIQLDVTSLDSVEPRNTRAFRDIFYRQMVGSQAMTSRIDLDKEPIISD